jgi:phosphomannomutase/phosphoglucomutase
VQGKIGIVMKLSLKKNEDETAKKSSAASSDKKSSTPRFKKLSHSVVISLLAVVVGILGQALLVNIAILAPAETKQTQKINQDIASMAAARVSQQMDFVVLSLKHWITVNGINQILDQPALIQQNEKTIANAIPYVEHALIGKKGSYSIDGDKKDGSSTDSISFASLDLVRRVEQGQKASPELFLDNNQWKVQVAVPIYANTGPASDSHSGKSVEGVALIMFSTDLIKHVLHVPNGLQTGKLILLQHVGVSEKSIIETGNGRGTVVNAATRIPGWTVSYQPASAGNYALLDKTLYWILAGVFVLLALAGAAVPLVLMIQRIKKESITVTRFTQFMITGERKPLPDVKLDFFFTMSATFQRIASGINKERQAASKEAAPAAKASAADSASSEAAPLFQEDDVLDIDMFEGDDDLLGLSGDKDTISSHEEVSEPEDDMLQEIARVNVPQSIFRAYDIRGIVGETLTEEVVEQIGLALGSEALAINQPTLCVGYDGRHSSPSLANALISGIVRTGCNVINIGRVPTPVLYFATHHLETGSGVMITGSHNPANYNGFKMMLGGDTLANEAIQKLYQRIDTQNYASGQGQQKEQSVSQAYLDVILNDIAVAAPLKVVVDAGNGIAGELGPQLIEELGCEVIPLYCEVDGDFPNHHPDPGKPENLQDLIRKVEEEGADIGLAFDGDGDRIGVVTNKGKIIYPDRLLMLFAKDVVSRNPGADVIFDVKCTRRLNGLIGGYGGRPIMWKTGHSLIKAKMKETGALLAGEMSGHIFFKERWYGFDDGLYSAARLLEILGIDERTADVVFNAFPEDISTPEINIEVTDQNKFALVERLGEIGLFGEGSISTIDGIRVDYQDGWGLCRASNTTPVLVLRFEADSEASLERIKGIFREQLNMVESGLGDRLN